MREIVLDTETTGLSPTSGHRIIDIGCIELYLGLPTGKEFQQYINPERDVPAEAFAVHGLSRDFLKPFPTFDRIIDAFLEFIKDSTLVIHNAKFDMTFLNAELARFNRPALANEVVDTLKLAKQRFPGAPASLDSLCRRLQIDLKQRAHHGALLDAKLLTQVYPALQQKTILQWTETPMDRPKHKRSFKKPRTFDLSDQERTDYSGLLRLLHPKQ
jgi:DNA polymerase-3 subunit epsilon